MWQIEIIAAMTIGGLGSVTFSRVKICEIRKREAVTSAKLIDENYYYLERMKSFSVKTN